MQKGSPPLQGYSSVNTVPERSNWLSESRRSFSDSQKTILDAYAERTQKQKFI
jgi:hypothetical protein